MDVNRTAIAGATFMLTVEPRPLEMAVRNRLEVASATTWAGVTSRLSKPMMLTSSTRATLVEETRTLASGSGGVSDAATCARTRSWKAFDEGSTADCS